MSSDILKSLDERLAKMEKGDVAAAVKSDFVVHNDAHIEVEVRDLKEAAEATPDHPHAEVYLKAITGMPMGAKVSVPLIDLQALRQNKVVTVNKIESEENGQRIITQQKQLGDTFVPEKKEKVPTKAPPAPNPVLSASTPRGSSPTPSTTP